MPIMKPSSQPTIVTQMTRSDPKLSVSPGPWLSVA
jgi:hypothetical protein